MENLQPVITVGVVSDTHIPDRVGSLHPGLIPALRAAGIQHIIHAGDICAPSVLRELEKAAPVVAVRGNRDMVFHNRLPWVQRLEINGVVVAVLHGHGSWGHYIRDKVRFFFEGYRLEAYLPLLTSTHPEAKVVVFGHTHFPENINYDGKLIFNPGSASLVWKDAPQIFPTFGLLHFYQGGEVRGEVVPIKGARLEGRTWVKTVE